VEGGSKSGSGDGVKVGAGLPDSSIVASAAKGKGPGEEFSSAILSSEAERILENAKKRLTVCGDPTPEIEVKCWKYSSRS
jgi:hypothetical protein